MTQSSTITIGIQKRLQGSLQEMSDTVAVEEPLEMRVGFLGAIGREVQNIAITMRTPGNDSELAAGFLFSEGLIQSADEIQEIRQVDNNILQVELRDSVEFDFAKLSRQFQVTSSCGICGKNSLDSIRNLGQFQLSHVLSPIDQKGPTVRSELIYQLPELLRKSQNHFEHTGGMHASALFNSFGEILITREDVGRHNALDKVIGNSLLNRQLPLSESILMLSGRISFELVQKATQAGIRFIVAVGAPSSLACELAREADLTLIGFVKPQSFNIYHGAWRIS